MPKKRLTTCEKRKSNKLTTGEMLKLQNLKAHIINKIIDYDKQFRIADWMISSFIIPDYFPRELGVKLYNQSLQKLISEGEETTSWKNKEERKRVISEFKTLIQNFRAMVDRAIDGEKPTGEDKKIIETALLRGEVLRVIKDDKTGRFHPAIYGNVPHIEDQLWAWVYGVWGGEIKVKRCKAKDCNRVFIPVRSDKVYCSVNCRTRSFHQRKSSLNE
ncbi:MAG: hypothetical protein ACE5K3_02715 [bacterium]